MRRPRTLLGIIAGAMTVATALPASSAAEQQVPRMSLREKVGQLVMFGVEGRSLTAEERDVIARQHLGAVILFDHNYSNRTQLARLTDQIQAAARRGSSLRAGALIAVDQEGGVVKRFDDMPPRYSAPEMGRIGRTSVAYDQGRATGGALRRAGVNIDLAPVGDLDLPPEHVMRSRSFGPGENKVARLARAFGRGLQSRRVAAATKHFPGFGGASVNSDYGRAYIRRSKWQLHHVDAVPFHAAVEGGIRMIMLSHGMYLNDGGRIPASVSYYIATTRLRDEFAFTGVAISDALEPVAWRFDGDVDRACKATIKAGVDIALITGNVYRARACARSVRTAVREGKLPERRIDQAVARVLALKEWLGLYEP
ncbi:MAG: glycoside hydrolase family 3 protein [Actinomycetota bacterium]